mmetsp:Transcript_63658/g.105850  ORF Transcript_63658/g.105850 Transcript_63658/m.105850 type:complete len:95 (-) Transcript_63658:1056-1340(-)
MDDMAPLGSKRRIKQRSHGDEDKVPRCIYTLIPAIEAGPLCRKSFAWLRWKTARIDTQVEVQEAVTSLEACYAFIKLSNQIWSSRAVHHLARVP